MSRPVLVSNSPPRMRRVIHEILRLKTTVGGVVRVSKDLERYTARINATKWRFEDWQTREESGKELIEMFEEELDRIRKELRQTDTIMAEVAG